MESHVLNSYHQARYRTIGHKIMRAKSDSLSSESSSQFNQNSPEYPRIAIQRPGFVENGVGEWSHNQSMNTTQSSQDTSSDGDSSDGQEDIEENITHVHRDEDDEQIEENILVQEVSINDDDDDDDESIVVDDDHVDASVPVRNGYNFQITDPGSLEDNTLIEGHDYDVITVYTVNPDLDLSSEDETEDFSISDNDKHSYIKQEYINTNHVENTCQTYTQDVAPDISIDLNLDTPVVSNVDEYFIKHKDILETDGPVVKDVDEYFIKDKGKEESTTVNVDDFFIKHKLPEEEFGTPFDAPKALTNGYEFSNAENIKKEPIIKTEEPIVETVDAEPDNNGDIINESDLEVLPNIEDLKRYLLEEMSYTKFKSIQRSCSLPQSPMQNICMDIDDAKTCLSFEDLNLDLSDLAFDEKDKSDVTNKSDDIPRTLTDEDVNSFLITNNAPVAKTEDDLSHQDMEIERTIDSKLNKATVENSFRELTSTPLPAVVTPTVLDFCIEKTPIKKEPIEPDIVKTVTPKTPKTASININPVLPEPKPVPSVHKLAFEPEDFVDVESCNDTIIPVLAANNLNSLLEQFEATEKLNGSKETVRAAVEVQKKVNKSSLTNGMRLQDAGVQLNKNKMRQILMPSTISTAVKRSPSPIRSDHDYCSSKKRHSLPNIKGGQSLLKPEVLSSNNKILSSRHRTCKNKKVVYALSSDDEADTKDSNKKLSDSEFKKKTSVKPAVKPPAQSNCRKKLSPPHCVASDVDVKDKINNSVIYKSASKASDTPSSQNSICSIKLTIKNKSEVILNCDHKDSQKDKLNNNIEKCKTSSSSVDLSNVVTNAKQEKHIKDVDRNKGKTVNKDNLGDSVSVKEEPRPKDENFYTTLFSNKQDVKIPPVVTIKKENNAFEEELNKAMEIKKEEPQKKKKLNLQEYKLRRGVSSSNSSTTVSPEAIFPDMPNLFNSDKSKNIIPASNGSNDSIDKTNTVPKKIFDPIREASRKILMNNKKQKAEALRKRDEDIVMSKIPKVDNLQLQPLISEAEMAKIVGMKEGQTTQVHEKPQVPADYEEIIMVSVGTNTDDKVFKELQTESKPINNSKRKSTTPPLDPKSHINFKIKKSDNILKQNVFDTVKRDKRSPVDESKHTETRIDKERFKDITAVLKSVGKQVDTKISSNSLFASIQDTVMKKAPEKEKKDDNKRLKSSSPVDKHKATKTKLPRTAIVKDYNDELEHGEDKVILHLGRNRLRPESISITIQTEPARVITEAPKTKTIAKEKSSVNRRRNDSDMSMSSDASPIRYTDKHKADKITTNKTETVQKSQCKEKRSRSKDRYDTKYRRRSRSLSRNRRRRRSPSRSRRSPSRSRRSPTRSRSRSRRYRRSDSPYKRKRRSRSRSRSYHKRRSPSIKRDQSYKNRSRSRSRVERSKSPVTKKLRSSPQNDRKIKSMTPPLRKPTVSESSDSSTSSSSSSSSSSSGASECSGKCRSPYKREEFYRKKPFRSYSSDDRENNTPVEERRIVFVGKLEKDITKASLRSQFFKFGPVIEVRLHSKEDGSRYGFVTYQRARDAWTAVEAASTFPHYDVGFGGRRAFCRQSYADLDGLEAKYTESAFHTGASAVAPRRIDDMSFEQMLLEMKKKLSQRKNDKKVDKP